MFLFFYFFVRRVLFTPFAVFFKINLAFNQLFVFTAPVVNAFTFSTREFNKSIL